jgi:hypothetical protein
MLKKTILKFSLFILTLFFAFFFWRSVDHAINVAGASDWIVPSIWFTFYFVFLALSIVLMREAYLAETAILLSLLLSIIFVLSWWHLIIIILAFLLLSIALVRIRKDLRLNIKINFWKTVRTGSTLIIFSLSLVIASQYYFEIKNSGRENLMPKFSMGGFSEDLTSKILGYVYPNLASLDGENLTVDQMILKAGDDQVGREDVAQMTTEQKKIVLDEGRKQISQIVGENVTGDENVASLFSEAINNKINNFITPKLVNDDMPILPVIMTFVLFLTVVSLGSFFSPLLILIADVIFIILVKTKVVTVNKVMKEVEELA